MGIDLSTRARALEYLNIVAERAVIALAHHVADDAKGTDADALRDLRTALAACERTHPMAMPEVRTVTFCPICQESLGGKSPAGRKGYVDIRTLHVVGVETPEQVFALCGDKFSGKIDEIEIVPMAGR